MAVPGQCADSRGDFYGAVYALRAGIHALDPGKTQEKHRRGSEERGEIFLRQTKPLKPFTGRILILSGILVVVFAAIFLRMNVMMRTNYESYAQTASSSATKTLSVTGMRGTIYDTNMTPLAYDRVSYNVTFYRDPSKMSEEDRWNYTKSILETIRLVDSNGKTTINEFWLQKDEDNVWRFKTGSTSETVEQTRENQWRANFRETSTPEEDLMDSLLEKYFDLDVLRDELWQE